MCSSFRGERGENIRARLSIHSVGDFLLSVFTGVYIGFMISLARLAD